MRHSSDTEHLCGIIIESDVFYNNYTAAKKVWIIIIITQ